MNNPVFILGAPRSGTTFLASLLKKTRYGEPFETQFVLKYFHKLNDYGNLDDAGNLEKLIRDISAERAVMQWQLSLDANQLLAEMGGKFDYGTFVNAVCSKASQSGDDGFWGEKTPAYLADIDAIATLFPAAKFIYIVRDGRDVALSLLEKDWGPNNIYYCAKYWNELNTHHGTITELKRTGRLIELKYENLMENFNENTVRVFDFLDHPYSELDLQALSATPIQNNFNKWKRRMTPGQIKIFETIAGNTLNHFGYECSHSAGTVNPLVALGYKLHNLIFRVRHLFIINVVDGIKIKFFGKQPFAE